MEYAKKVIFNLYRYLPIIVSGFCIFLISIVLLQDRSLFLDSLNLARNVVEKDYAGLASLLNYEQTAPVLFLWLSKTSILLFDVSSFSLRAIPYVFGVISILLFYQFGKNWLTPLFLSLAILILFGNIEVVRYATEFKQYIGDLMITIVFMILPFGVKQLSTKSTILIFTITILSLWISMPSIFFIASYILYLFINYRKNKNHLFTITFLAILLSAMFLFNYLYLLNPIANSNNMVGFHQDYFIHGKFWSMDSMSHDLGLLVSFFRIIVGKNLVPIASIIVLSIIGVYTLYKSQRNYVLYLLAPSIMVLFTSLIHKYSMIERLMLFNLPVYVFLSIYGLQVLFKKCITEQKILQYGLLALTTLGILLGMHSKSTIKYLENPYEKEDNQTIIESLSDYSAEEITLICSKYAYPAFTYYANYDKNIRFEHNFTVIQSNNDASYLTEVEHVMRQNREAVLITAHIQNDVNREMVRKLEEKYEIKNMVMANQSMLIEIATK